MRRVFFFLFFVSAMLSLPASAKRLTHGFRIAKIELSYPCHPEWEVQPTPEVIAILKQPFHFIGRGTQSFVFESKDGQYVVKLFRYDRPAMESKIIALFDACKIAYDQLCEETGLIYVHLNSTDGELPTLRCKDALGRRYKLPLNRYRFALQKKARPFFAVFEEALPNPKEMERRIDQFIDLLQARTAKQVRNADPSLGRNFGFLEDRAVEFDFGNYRQCTTLNQGVEMRRYTDKLRRWLEKRAPEWVPYLESKI